MPLAQAAIPVTDPATVEIRVPKGGKEVVLLVDDERGVRTVVQEMLKSFGLAVTLFPAQLQGDLGAACQHFR